MTRLATPTEVDRYCAFLRTQPLPLSVEHKPWKKSRSNDQNALLFGGMYPPIAEAMGFDVSDLHTWCCGQFFGWTERKVPRTPHNRSGLESVPIRTTTRDADGKRNVIDAQTFSRFVELVERTAAQAGVFIPDMRAAA